MTGFTRKKVADMAGVTIETVLYYEKERLIPEPPRTAIGYREYPLDTVERILFIKRAQSLGFSLPEIRELLSLRVTPGSTAADIRDRVQLKIQNIEDKIQALQAIQQTLVRISESCHGQGPVSDCPILDALDKGY